MLALEHVEVRYPRFTLGPVSLTVAPGDRIVLAGRNASGKSTLLSVLAGRRRPTSGTLRFLDSPLDPEGTVPLRAQVALVAADTGSCPWLTVGQQFALLADVMPGFQVHRALALADRLELDPDATAGTLSRGSVMKLGLCCAWGQRPRVLLLDEPTAGLDPVARERLLQEIDTLLAHDDAPALVYTTHLLEEIEALHASAFLILHRGAATLHPVTPGDTPAAAHALALLREDA